VAIEVACECGNRFRVGDEALGHHVGCPACGRALLVSKGSEPWLIEDATPTTSGKAIASLILGILSFGCTFFTGLPAIILGAMGLSDIGKGGGQVGGKGMAIAGVILGSIGSLMTFFVLILAALLFPAVQAARSAAQRAQCVNNLKQIGLAFHNFEDKEGHFPAQAITDPQGKPLLSWRVAILPYIEQESLYKQFKLDEPWDSPNNLPLLSQMPSIYQCQSVAPGGAPSGGSNTRYQGIAGPGALFEGAKAATLRDITDGTSNTILVAEGKQPVPWTKPDDIPIASITTSLGSGHPGGVNAVFLDGSVKFLKTTLNPAVLQSLATRNGGEVVTPDAY
jgi:prepilin-type processing-associated H-X9-DG protein